MARGPGSYKKGTTGRRKRKARDEGVEGGVAMTSEVQLKPSAGEHSVPDHDAAGRLCGDMLRPDCGCVWSTRPEAQAQSTDVYNATH